MRRISEEINIQNKQIIEIAINQFCDKGYAKTRLDDIAKELNITKTPIYYHFKDKAGLFYAAYKKAIDEVYSKDIEVFTKNCSLYEKLTEAFVTCAITSNQLKIDEMSRILVKEKEELAETLQYMTEINEMFYKFKTAAIRVAKETGEIKQSVDIDEMYAIINACYSGVLSWVSGIDRDKTMTQENKEEMTTKMLSTIFEALKPMYFN